MNQKLKDALRINNAKIDLKKAMVVAEAADTLADTGDIQLVISIICDYMSKALDELEGSGVADQKDGDQDEVE